MRCSDHSHNNNALPISPALFLIKRHSPLTALAALKLLWRLSDANGAAAASHVALASSVEIDLTIMRRNCSIMPRLGDWRAVKLPAVASAWRLQEKEWCVGDSSSSSSSSNG
jgi:hypothetical protein